MMEFMFHVTLLASIRAKRRRTPRRSKTERCAGGVGSESRDVGWHADRRAGRDWGGFGFDRSHRKRRRGM